MRTPTLIALDSCSEALCLDSLAALAPAEQPGRTRFFSTFSNEEHDARYSSNDDPDARNDWDAQFSEWLRGGNFVFPQALIQGIGRAAEAMPTSAEGTHFGTVAVEL